MSGTIKYNITINKKFQDIFSHFEESQSNINYNNILFMSRNEIYADISKIEGLTIQRLIVNTVDNIKTISINLQFDNLNSLPNILMQDFFPLNTYTERKNTYLSTSFKPAIFGDNKYITQRYDAYSTDEKKIFDSYTELIKLKFTFNFPDTDSINFKSSSIGFANQKEKTISFELTAKDILSSLTPVTLDINMR